VPRGRDGGIRRFQLDDHHTFNEHVDSQTRLDIGAFVWQAYAPPALKFEVGVLQLDGQAFAVSRFEQAGTKRLVNLDSAAELS
jgi:hypothetical protein